MANIGNVTVTAGQAVTREGRKYWTLNIGHNGGSFNISSQQKLDAFLAIARAASENPESLRAFETEMAKLVANRPNTTPGGTRFIPAD